MDVSKDEVERRSAAMAAALRSEGMRLTRQRLEIIREIAGTDSHPDVEEVFTGVRARVPTVSVDTIYRALAALAATGLVKRVSAMPGPSRYDANSSGHHHFICTRCGRISDIEDDDLDRLQPPDATRSPGTVESTEVYFKGVCTTCTPNREGAGT